MRSYVCDCVCEKTMRGTESAGSHSAGAIPTPVTSAYSQVAVERCSTVHAGGSRWRVGSGESRLIGSSVGASTVREQQAGGQSAQVQSAFGAADQAQAACLWVR